ncbi:hypothetical protein UL82_00495 [Corynebacterium kutscheri]|uniref:Uncharacterized protein n=1 Tax=Corynebacterium kutscheri TaxID=35755 RepID=A0A0F6QY22_9CORY|nr:hypothetical protein UL82_00495 [Corynebacterium kutscheri]VEH05406.1 Uncharacterised protein [Corynebacterium kutscheri]VEH10731.1 Uncharacterised protein [Corynebacterium kutscheri]
MPDNGKIPFGQNMTKPINVPLSKLDLVLCLSIVAIQAIYLS